MEQKGDSGETHQTRESPILLYGDEFLVKEEVRKIAAETVDSGLRDTNFITLDGNNLNLGDLSSHLFTPSLFGGSRLILVEQTTVFMSRGDQRKLVEKAVQSWRGGERKAAFRAMGQILTLAGLSPEDLDAQGDWVSHALGTQTSADEKETLSAIADALVAEGVTIRSRGDDTAFLEGLIASPLPEDTVLVFTAPAVDKRNKLFLAVQKRGSVIECAPREGKYGTGLDKSFLQQRVKEVLANAGKTISPDGLETICSRSGKDLRRLQGELEKLIGFVGDRQKVTADDVENVFSDFHQAGFFDFTNALRSGDAARCLPALRENLKVVEHPLVTLGIIASETRKLLAARELLFTVFRPLWQRRPSFDRFQAELARIRQENPKLTGKGKFALLSLKEYPLYYLLRDAEKFPLERLTRAMEAILDADVLMKSSRIGYHAPEAILENLVLVICSPAKPLSRKPPAPHERAMGDR